MYACVLPLAPWLVSTISNVFVPVTVTCEVQEEFDNTVKRNVTVKNTGDVDAYIRAVVIATFVSENGTVLATAPTEGVDYTVTWATDGWVKGTDGYWYHGASVAPEATTAPLIKTATVVKAPSGYSLNLQIIATAMQSDPVTAVEEAWGVTVSNGNMVPN